MNKVLLILSFVFLASLLFYSCEDKKERVKNEQLTCIKTECIQIKYGNDDIIIYEGKDTPNKDRLFYKDNVFYDDKDSIICLSLKDTVFFWKDHFGQKYKREIRKINSNEYSCLTTDITFLDCANNMDKVLLDDGEIFLSLIYYDNQYRINKIIRRSVDVYICQ